jgi:hypothetical protein
LRLAGSKTTIPHILSPHPTVGINLQTASFNSPIHKIFGVLARIERQVCHARRQRFQFRPQLAVVVGQAGEAVQILFRPLLKMLQEISRRSHLASFTSE